MKCCGEERTGNFCSECGNPLGSTLHSLLRHVGTHARQIRDRCNFTKARYDRDPNPYLESSMARTLKAAEKWESWQAELQKLLKECQGD